ncbi:unnamed protein product [Rangifer tarandus platyrhynchus]|uniref:Uncharacterized protein n=2 Tax=Rangifer tarandus platyrhynchus TaxID=3082113 RepID=A0ACB0F5A5_RANTA|nr:unnamed protein product [Rangifer tarandus platyrhynchus]CAI9707829.1 unnamed protein product [Rangifer tarandus platyrhynchus]
MGTRRLPPAGRSRLPGSFSLALSFPSLRLSVIARAFPPGKKASGRCRRARDARGRAAPPCGAAERQAEGRTAVSL